MGTRYKASFYFRYIGSSVLLSAFENGDSMGSKGELYNRDKHKGIAVVTRFILKIFQEVSHSSVVWRLDWPTLVLLQCRGTFSLLQFVEKECRQYDLYLLFTTLHTNTSC